MEKNHTKSLILDLHNFCPVQYYIKKRIKTQYLINLMPPRQMPGRSGYLLGYLQASSAYREDLPGPRSMAARMITAAAGT